MKFEVWIVLCILLPPLAFLFGALPFSFWIAKFWKGIDIRVEGSGNPGASNVYRTAGRLPGAAAFLLDTGKGVLPVAAAAALTADHGIPWGVPSIWFHLLTGFASAAGHIWSPFLGFRGGKGVATFLGMFLMIFPSGVIMAFTVGAVLIAITRYFSLGSLAGAVVLPLSYFLFVPKSDLWTGDKVPVLFVCVLAAFLIFYRHRENITRLLKGNEFSARPE